MADVSREMRNWGIVVINPIYTHASNDTGNSPTGDYGASSANILRASKAWDILCGLGYVDMSRIAAHGHSAGAFVTTAVLDAYPSDFKVGSHTAGGTNGCKSTCGFSPIFPALSQRDNITAPYSLHHGDQDSTVPLSFDQNLYNEFQGYGLTSELRIYAGLTHSTVRANPNVLANIKQWYSTYGMFTPTVHPTDTQAPSVSITSPSSGSTVSGTINVSANASDNVGVAGVQFKLDGNNLGSEVTSPPFSVSWDTSAASNGSHIITAIARDAVGNSSTTAVTVRTYRRRVWVW
jgi:predicted esterase